MKIIRLLSLLLALAFFASCGDGGTTETIDEVIVPVKVEYSEVPDSIKRAFIVQYPAITDVSWSKVGDAYLAEYIENEMRGTMTYDLAGLFVSSGVQISADDLPAVVKDYIAQNMGEYSIGDAFIATGLKSMFYYVDVISDGQEMELKFDISGSLIERNVKPDAAGANQAEASK